MGRNQIVSLTDNYIEVMVNVVATNASTTFAFAGQYFANSSNGAGTDVHSGFVVD